MADTTDEWDEWGNESDAAAAPARPAEHPRSASSAPVSDASNAPLGVPPSGQTPPSSPRKLLDWAWDLGAIDADLAALAPSARTSTAQPAHNDMDADGPLHALAARAGPTLARLRELGHRTQAMRAQAAVAQWKLRRLAHGLLDGDNGAREDDQELVALERALQELAGEWGHVNDADTPRGDKARELTEMSSLLQHALAASDEDDDTAPFQQALEQLFASLPGQQLVVPVAWIRPNETTTDASAAPSPGMDAFVAQLAALCDEDEQRSLSRPTDAQVFQDTKDVQRDELVVDGEHVVGGAVGYATVVDTIVAHLHSALARASLVEHEKDKDVTDALLRHAAQHILTACNRTESGGCSYEILSQFVTQHSTDRVLIRPASARAPPLAIASDVGVFLSRDAGWCLGLRVRVAAVTWYCVCDADDPTRELCDVETTYANRLAFPLGHTPLAPRDLLRRDGGDVTIALRRETARTETDAPTDHGNVDFDALL